ncbi:hypothetical protein TNCV_2090881 [Trichonephila clavipes]|nr:hypothetical protein TNCV_2090881 [Trichonephila clavipes]
MRALGAFTCPLRCPPDRSLHKISENESNGGELSCSNLDSNDDIRLNESDYKESADMIDKIPVNPPTYVARDSTEWTPHNGNVLGRFTNQNVLQ